jgi:hypothetical protein
MAMTPPTTPPTTGAMLVDPPEDWLEGEEDVGVEVGVAVV